MSRISKDELIHFGALEPAMHDGYFYVCAQRRIPYVKLGWSHEARGERLRTFKTCSAFGWFGTFFPVTDRKIEKDILKLTDSPWREREGGSENRDVDEIIDPLRQFLFLIGTEFRSDKNGLSSIFGPDSFVLYLATVVEVSNWIWQQWKEYQVDARFPESTCNAIEDIAANIGRIAIQNPQVMHSASDWLRAAKRISV